MHTETEEYIDDELLDERAEEKFSHEREERRFEYEEQDDVEAEEHEEVEPGTRAVLEYKGGEAEDWELAYRGDSGYRFDGECIRDPDGNVWMNEDRELHEEMLAQWKEGSESVFFLPDYRESEDGVEILFVTQLILGEDGRVTYEIHKHEMYRAEDETSLSINDIEEHTGAQRAEYETEEYSDTESHEEKTFMDALEAHEYVEIAPAENFDAPTHAAAQEISIKTTGRAPEIAQEAGADKHSARETGADKHVECEQPDAWLIKLLTGMPTQREQSETSASQNKGTPETMRQCVEAVYEREQEEPGYAPAECNLDSLESEKIAIPHDAESARNHARAEASAISVFRHADAAPRVREDRVPERETKEIPQTHTESVETRVETRAPVTLLSVEQNQTSAVSFEARQQEQERRERRSVFDAGDLRPDVHGHERVLEAAPTPLSESHGELSERAQHETILRALGMKMHNAYDSERGYVTAGAGLGISPYHDDHAEPKRGEKERRRLSMDGISMEIEIAV